MATPDFLVYSGPESFNPQDSALKALPARYKEALDKVSADVRTLVGFGEDLFDIHVYYLSQRDQLVQAAVFTGKPDERLGVTQKSVDIVRRSGAYPTSNTEVPAEIRKRFEELLASEKKAA